MTYKLIQGDCIEVLKILDAGSIQTCVTSPPYYGLRDYGTAKWEGGDPECNHEPDKTSPSSTLEGGKSTQGSAKFFRISCPKCGAIRIDSQIGLEETPEAYVEKLVAVFREVWRVLRDDGTLWLNLGDCYAHSTSGGGGAVDIRKDGRKTTPGDKVRGRMANMNTLTPGLKPKDLIGIPWLVAFALRADGWYLRSDIIWHKPNPMPESVTDRCTKSHEYIFLLSKSAKYYYDADAIREPTTTKDESIRDRDNTRLNNTPGRTKMGGLKTNGYDLRNKRDVWTVNTFSYTGAHYATFPPKLITPCILAGSKTGDWVLDPFIGSGTTALVATGHGRNCIGIDLNPENIRLSHERIGGLLEFPYVSEME